MAPRSNARNRDHVCSVIPSGKATGISAGISGVASVCGGGEVVVNYNSGQVSAFGFGGLQAGWKGGASGSVYSGFISGLTDSNSNYAGGFTGSTVARESVSSEHHRAED